MICFPQLSTGSVAQFPIEKRRVSRTVVNAAADGTTLKLADAAVESVEWRLRFETLSDDERSALATFHTSVEGQLGAFTFLDPTDNLFRWSEELDESVWERNSLLTLTASVADPNGGTRATRVRNTGAATLTIEQTLNSPGWFQYGFGLQARSSESQQITLIRSTATQTHSKAFDLGSNWKQILLSGKFGGAEEAVTFAIGIGAGKAIELFGIQAEAQAGASGYKATQSRGGVYSSAHFLDDELTVTTDWPNQHSTRIRIRARV